MVTLQLASREFSPPGAIGPSCPPPLTYCGSPPLNVMALLVENSCQCESLWTRKHRKEEVIRQELWTAGAVQAAGQCSLHCSSRARAGLGQAEEAQPQGPVLLSGSACALLELSPHVTLLP